MTPDSRQTAVDTFYAKNGACCAGCDHWHWINSIVGECRRSAPVSGAERAGMLQMHSSSLPPEAGHILTMREHHCGEFVDAFDWASLPAHYLRRIGMDKTAS